MEEELATQEAVEAWIDEGLSELEY